MRISIVTPTLNRREFLREALSSIGSQGHPDCEHIIVDGGSVDGTREMLAGRPDLVVLNDKRQGLYSAINQGIEGATGEILGILNSDDLYPAGALAAVERAFLLDPQLDSVCGAAEVFAGDNVIRRYEGIEDLRLDDHNALVGACLTNARFFRRRVFERVGLFSLEFPRVADREFLARALRHGIRDKILSETVYRYRQHDNSLTFGPDATNSASFRTELLDLARSLGTDRNASSSMRKKAQALEGRCLLTLGSRRIRRLEFDEFGRLMLMQNDRISLRPALAIVSALADLGSKRRF